MSNLKHLNLPELLAAERHCQKRIQHHTNKMAGEKERLKWIRIYKKEKETE